MVKVRIYRTKSFEYAFRVKTANGKIILDSAESYKTRQGVRSAVSRLGALAGAKETDTSPLTAACEQELVREEAEHEGR